METDKEKIDTDPRLRPTIVGALGGMALSAAIILPEVIRHAQAYTSGLIIEDVILTAVLVMTTAYIGYKHGDHNSQQL